MKLNELTEQEIKALDSVVEKMDVNIMKMSVGDVVQCIMSEKSLVDYVESLNYTIFEKYAFVKGFVEKANLIFSTFKKYNDDVPIEYTLATSNIDGLSMVESIIVDCVKFYGLRSTEEAEKLPFGDWYLMKRNEVINGAIERKYNKILIDKQKNESKRFN